MRIKCLIVDDELTARQGLELLCKGYLELEIVSSCKDGVEAIDAIHTYSPDLLLLDIQMPKVNGFEALESLAPPLPQVIFITAHDEFAIKAFEVNAVDYLLKPFSDERFDKAIQRAINQIKSKAEQNLNPLMKSVRKNTETPDLRHADDERLIVKSDGRIQVIPKRDIIQAEAFDYYVKIHIQDRFFLIRETMKSLETRLQDSRFMRTHKSHIVNKEHIKEVYKRHRNDYEILTTNGQIVKVSRSRISDIKKWLG